MRTILISLFFAAALTLSGCGAATKTIGGTTAAPSAAAVDTPPLGCGEAVRIITEIHQHPERLGYDDGRQAAEWAGQLADKVMSTELAKQETSPVSELHAGLTTIAIAFPEDTPRAVRENRPKIDSAAERILLACGHAPSGGPVTP